MGGKIYFDGAKPDWYEKAVQLKTDNPRMSASEIGRQVGVAHTSIIGWLTGKPDSKGGNIYNDNPPFTLKDFTHKYFDGEKPKWYEKAIAMRKQGMIYPAIANKLSTPEKRIMPVRLLMNWLVKGRKYNAWQTLSIQMLHLTPRPYNTTTR